MVCMSLLPGSATMVRYIRRYVITEYVTTGLYCIVPIDKGRGKRYIED